MKEKVSTKVLLDGAQMGLAALLVGTMSFLKKRKIPIKDWVSYIGSQFEGSWEVMEDEAVSSVMEHFLTLEVLPMGAEVLSSSATTRKAEVAVTPLPSQKVLKKFGTTPSEMLRDFGVTAGEIESFYAMYEPAAAAIGLRFYHQRKDGKQILVLEKLATRKRK